jgi:phage-related protein
MVSIVLYRDADGACPVLDFLDIAPREVRVKAHARIELLATHGHRLRRPHADYIGRGLYELRWRHHRVNYRLLYFFHGTQVIVIVQGLTKEDRLPAVAIAQALERKRRFEAAPGLHTYAHEIAP